MTCPSQAILVQKSCDGWEVKLMEDSLRGDILIELLFPGYTQDTSCAGMMEGFQGFFIFGRDDPGF